LTRFPVYASRFQLFPEAGEAYNHLKNLFSGLGRIDFSFSIVDPTKNNGQMVSDFDDQLKNAVFSHGATPHHLKLPPEIRHELDFAFEYGGHSVAVEVEKTNREKILRDIMKCHIYMQSGADSPWWF
jgi:hypothetical protein